MRIWSDSRGFSLIEILVVVGIVGILLVIGGRFIGQADEGRVVGKAREESQKINRQLQELIERDLRFRQSDTSYAVSPDQKVLTVTRRQALDINNLQTSDQTYQVRFETVCRPVPSQLGAYPELAQQLLTDRFKNGGNCLRATNCGTGQLPRVEITVTGSGRIPPYPNKIFPSPSGISTSFRNHALAAALCFATGSEQVRVTVDTIYAVSKDQYAPVSQDKSLSLKSADFQLLPQEFKP